MTLPLYDLQPFTLVDYPGRVACTLFMAGCNLRCPYCHNADLIAPVEPPRIDEASFFEFLERRKGLLEGVCVTGGEPTLNDLSGLFNRIRDAGFAVKLDTNGTRPEAWIPLVKQGLVDFIAMDIKTPPASYALMGASAEDVRGVVRSVEYLLSSPVDYEFRTTLHPNWLSEEDIRQMAAWLRGAKRLALQPFTLSEKVLDPDFCQGPGYATEKLHSFREILLQEIETVVIRGD